MPPEGSGWRQWATVATLQAAGAALPHSEDPLAWYGRLWTGSHPPLPCLPSEVAAAVAQAAG